MTSKGSRAENCWRVNISEKESRQEQEGKILKYLVPISDPEPAGHFNLTHLKNTLHAWAFFKIFQTDWTFQFNAEF